MRPKIERLNSQIERLQAGLSLLPGGVAEDFPQGGFDPGEVAMLQMAAHLASLRPGASLPDPDFLAQLRARVLVEAVGGTNLASK